MMTDGIHEEEASTESAGRAEFALLGQSLHEPKFKYGDKVWVFVSPRALNNIDELPVFYAEVSSLDIQISCAYGNPPEVKKIEYELCLTDSIDTVYRKEAEVFETAEEAKQFGLNTVVQLRNKAGKECEIFDGLLEQMKTA